MRVILLEVRRSLRAPRSRAVAAVLAAGTLAACLVGGAVAETHRSIGARDAEASRERIRRAASSSAAPSAFDLAAWQDTSIARGLGPAAPLVAGELASLPDSAVVRIYEPPTLVPALAERSPAATLLGTLDLAWFLTLLVPLAAIALGYDAIAGDRERGTLAMLLVPARRPGAVVMGRIAGLFAVLFAGVVPAALLGAIAASAIIGASLLARDLQILALLLTAWCLLLAAVAVTTSAFSDRSATSLAALLGGWLLFGVAVPLAVNGLARLSYPVPDPRAQLLGEQAAQEVFARPSEAVIDAELERNSSFDPSLGTDGATSQSRYYFLLSRERYRRAKGARYAADRALARRVELLELASWLSPASMLSLSLSELAGGGPGERVRFTERAERFRVQLEEFVGARVLANEPSFQQPERWPALSRVPPSSPAAALAASVLFILLSIGLAAAGAGRMKKGSLAPTKEDA
jgi:ABC-2 type transport system permease protein